ncbi:MAG TPA: GldG family protein [Bryobacteraceae bacterium]|nr:GldG family protein [Bryobacteraceae bacterium]
MNANWLKTRQTKFAAYAATYILIVVAALAAANWLANRHNKSFDATTNKRYSLSDQTIKLASNLKDDVTITYFDAPRNFTTARDLLDRYDNLSTKLKVEYVDLLKNPQRARNIGAREGSIFLARGEKLQEARSLTEEEVTSALIRILKTAEKTVCFIQGGGEHQLDASTPDSYSGAKEQLEKNNYKVQAVELPNKPEIPQACSVVVVGGPRYEYPQAAVDALKKYVENGGRALIMVDPPLQSRKTPISENAALLKLLAGWGVTAKRNLVLSMGLDALAGLGSEVALSSSYTTHPIVRDMRGARVAFPLTRSLESKPTDKTSVENIALTSKTSIAVTKLGGELSDSDLTAGVTEAHALAAAGSYRRSTPADEGRFVVAGTSEFAANYALRYIGNRDLFLNMINWLASDEDLISIRPKDPEDRRIEMTRSQALLLKTTSQFIIPLCIILAGIFVWWRRR